MVEEQGGLDQLELDDLQMTTVPNDDVDAGVGRRGRCRAKRGKRELFGTRRRIASLDDAAIFRLDSKLPRLRNLAQGVA